MMVQNDSQDQVYKPVQLTRSALTHLGLDRERTEQNKSARTALGHYTPSPISVHDT